jgi:predicted permease
VGRFGCQPGDLRGRLIPGDLMLTDLRYAVRTLTHAPVFFLVVVLTLGLGIGANTAIFSLMDQVLLRLLPVSNPDELVQLDGPGTFRGRSNGSRTFSYPMYKDLRDQSDVFAGVVARAPAAATARVEGAEAERVSVEMISGNTFDVLGVRPAIGRALTPDDDRVPGGHPVVMLGHDYWTRRFAANPGVLGQAITINTTAMTVVGVAPAGFAGVTAMRAADVFVPLMMKAQITPTWNDLDNRQSRWVSIVARLAPAVTLDAARAGADVTYKQINAFELESVSQFAEASALFKERFRAKSLVVEPAGRGLSGLRQGFSTPLAVLMGMVGLVLLIACANVASLLVARAAARQKEIGVRLALGASRGRIVRQTLCESLILALAGGAVGLLLSVWIGGLLVGLLPSDGSARVLSTTPDLRMVLFTLGVSLLTAVIFGLAPAMQTSHPDMNRTLREEAGNLSGSIGHARLRKGLVVAQVALSMLLVAGAGLFARSLYNLKNLDPGFDATSLLSFSISPELGGYDQVGIKAFYAALQEDLQQVPGIFGVSMAAEPVLTDSVSSRTIQVQGYEPKPDENMNPWTNEVAPDYFRTMGMRLVLGREFTPRDAQGAPQVAVVNETFAKYYFGSENPIGRRFGWRAVENPGAIEIVGVVRDSLHGTMREGSGGEDNATPRFAYTPLQQSTELTGMTVYVRSSPGGSEGLVDRLRGAVQRRDAGLPIYNVTTMERTIDDAVFTERMLAVLSSAFGLLATALAAIGLYGLMSYTVARRTREIGIRIALGAERRSVVWLVLREVAVLTAIGIAVGIPAAVLLARVVSSQMFGLSATDPVTLVVAALTLATVGLLSGWLPARRAAAVQPVRALRYE